MHLKQGFQAALCAASLVMASCGSSLPATPTAGAPSAGGAGFDVREASIADAQSALRAGSVSCAALVDAYLSRIAQLDRVSINGGMPLNSVLTLAPNARGEAAAMDALQARGGWAGPLHCVPILLKDNYDSADFPTTDGSRALAGMQPLRDAFTVERLRAAGAIVLGKTTMAEFAIFPQSQNSWTQRVGTPYDTSKDSGGSSSGSAAGLAANLALAATGSDTCASIRLPPANNALVGVRSSIGLVSQAGIVPLSHFLDVGGPIARSVEDAARLLDVMAAVDPNDPATLDPERRQPASYTAFLRRDGLRGKRIGILRSYGNTQAFGNNAEIAAVTAQAISDLRAQGAEIVDPVDLPDFQDVAINIILQEFKSQFEDYLAGVPNAPYKTLAGVIASGKVNPLTEAIITTAFAASDTASPVYLANIGQRPAMRAYVEGEMDRLGLDALAFPPVQAPAQATNNVQTNNCGFGSTMGLPSMVVPAGFTTDPKPLPIGIEFLARKWDEGRLFEIGFAYEQATRHRRPPADYP